MKGRRRTSYFQDFLRIRRIPHRSYPWISTLRLLRQIGASAWTKIVTAMAGLLMISLLVHGGVSSIPDHREVRVKRAEITNSIMSIGRVQPNNRIDIRPPMGGRAEEVLVREGDRVRRGDILLWMSSYERASLLDAALNRSQEEYEMWKEKLPATPLVAPVSGRIIQRNIEPGQTFSTLWSAFVMADQLIVEVPIDETDLGKIKKGQFAEITLDPHPQQTLPGTVDRIAQDAETEDYITSYMTRVRIVHDPHSHLRVGMTANVRFDIETRQEALVIPIEALKSDPQGFHVLVPDPGARVAKKRPVEVGFNDGSKVEILSGLRENEIILIDHSSDRRHQVSAAQRAIQNIESRLDL